MSSAGHIMDMIARMKRSKSKRKNIYSRDQEKNGFANAYSGSLIKKEATEEELKRARQLAKDEQRGTGVVFLIALVTMTIIILYVFYF